MNPFFKGLLAGMKSFGTNISVIINSVLLALAYIVGVGVTAIIARIFGKRFLEKRLTKQKSYWNELKLKKRPTEEYYRQF